ncbi:LacI family DNA-binding transcriptional regulator [Actinoplanes sp. NBRC 103695]|uniref:LacI family DNA-binding transcriptional regulator n=1 Tax=Actinoplanes sp. NBRC 103695 TaxID=3032202 RepID=UPI0024A3288A|nr:LacI family DNA-binding transcriptional regulator [Actinoplanes sp. NBRC 103695]GLY95798.1 LacI family transcriptional regulator [Actinoplanes sp. NBRC 103695]
MTEFPTGRPTVYDVARVAGVSIKTVSRVVNRSSGVSDKTRRLVLEVVNDLGYVVNPAARSLVTGSSSTIGVIVDSIADPFFASLVSVVEVRALAAGFSTQVASTWRDPQLERDQLLRMTRENISGLLLAPTMGDHDYFAATVKDVPAVLVDRGWPGSGLDVVGVNDRAGARAAVEQLLGLGHRRIAFLGDDSKLTTTAHRRAGYLDALDAAGLSVPPELDRHSLLMADPGGKAVFELLELDEPPTALFSSNSRTSLGAVRALHKRRRTDVAMISFGDFDLADALEPGITVVDHDPALIATAAVDRLLARIGGTDLVPTEILLPTPLVKRGSGELSCSPS